MEKADKQVETDSDIRDVTELLKIKGYDIAVPVAEDIGEGFKQRQISPKYKIQLGEARQIDQTKATEFLTKMFPKGDVKLKLQKEIKTEEGAKALGRYLNKMVEVVETEGKISDATLYHESFHGFMDQLVNESEKSSLYKNINKNHLKEIKAIQKKYADQSVTIDLNEASEEFLSDEFAKYVQTKDTRIEPAKGLFARMLKET